MLKNICNKYTKIDNDLVNTYHMNMSPSVRKPTQCKSCVYYTNRNCREDIHDKMSNDHNFFC